MKLNVTVMFSIEVPDDIDPDGVYTEADNVRFRAASGELVADKSEAWTTQSVDVVPDEHTLIAPA